MRLESPLEIELDHEDGQLFSTLHIHAQKNSSARIIILKKSKKHTYLSTTVRILADAGSNVECINVQTMGPDAVHVEDNQASILKDASVSWTGLCLGSGYVRSHTISHLNGQGSATKNTVLYVATGKQRYDIYTASLHNAPHTSSQIVTRGAVNHEAKALSRGLVQIGEGAPGSNGYETQDALLLGDQAEADAIPNLEIHNHNVKCSHGSTIGQIDKDKVFYLMSRGLKKEQAQTKIVEGYFNPIIERISKDDVKRRIRDTIVRALR
jgi:Fe-S cluster assembly protein SufD